MVTATTTQHQTTSSAQYHSHSEETYSTANGTGNSSTHLTSGITPYDAVNLKDITAKNVPSIGEKAMHNIMMAGKTIQLDNLPPALREKVAEAVKDQPYAQKGAGHAKLIDLPPALARQVLGHKKDIETHGADNAKLFQTAIKGQTIQLDNLPPSVREKVAKAVEGQPYAEKGAGFAKLEDLPPALARQVMAIKSGKPPIGIGGSVQVGVALKGGVGMSIPEAVKHKEQMGDKTINLENLPPDLLKEVKAEHAAKDGSILKKNIINDGKATLSEMSPELGKKIDAYRNDAKANGHAYAMTSYRETKGQTMGLDKLPPELRKEVVAALKEGGGKFGAEVTLRDLPPALAREVLHVKQNQLVKAAMGPEAVAAHKAEIQGQSMALTDMSPAMRNDVAKYADKETGKVDLEKLPVSLSMKVLDYKKDVDLNGVHSAKGHQAQIKGETFAMSKLPPELAALCAPFATESGNHIFLENLPPSLSRHVLGHVEANDVAKVDAAAHDKSIKGMRIDLERLPPDLIEACTPYAKDGVVHLEDLPHELSVPVKGWVNHYAHEEVAAQDAEK